MSINRDYLALAQRLLEVLPDARIRGLYLPQPVPDETFRDEFGFVLLADGSVGPFYVSLGEALRQLWQRFPDPAAAELPVAGAIQGFAATDLASRALALGAFNALSQALLGRAGYRPPDRSAAAGLEQPAAGSTVGMVGYFCPLVDRLTAAGVAVRVLELAPQRVPERPLVSVTTRPAELADCSQVLCSASVLINDSLDELLAACRGAARFELVGPSGSGLPDVLFARGVSGVGGISFGDQALLRETLARQESWGKAGRKYQIAPADYPGIEALVADLG